MTALRMLEVFTLSTKKKGRIDESNGRVTRRIQKLQPRGPAMATSAKGTSINYFIAKTSGLLRMSVEPRDENNTLFLKAPLLFIQESMMDMKPSIPFSLSHYLKPALSILVVFSLIIPGAPTKAAPYPQSSPSSSFFRSCASIGDEAIQDELNSIVQQIYGDAERRLNLDAMVVRHWDALNMDAKLAKAVKDGIEASKRQTNGWEPFLSGLWPDKARELTEIVVTNTLSSTTFQTALDALTKSISDEIRLELEKRTAESSSRAIYCIQTFLGARYSSAMAETFTQRIKDINLGADIELAPSTLELLKSHERAIGGVGVIAATQLTKKVLKEIAEGIADRIADRIAKQAAGNVIKAFLKRTSGTIALVGWLIGVGLIIIDIMKSLDGALPLIEEALTSPTTKQHFQEQIATELKNQLRLHVELPAQARDVADNLYDEWRIMRAKMQKVLDLDEQDDAFRAFFENISSKDSLVRLVEIVDLLPVNSLRSTIDQAIESGDLDRVLALPEGVVTIVDDTRSIAIAARWGEIAGSRLNDVAELEIHKHRTPETIDPRHLGPLIGLRNKRLVATVLQLTNDQIDQYVDLPPTIFREMVEKFNAEHLAWLADQRHDLSEAERNTVLDAVRSNPHLLLTARAKGSLCGVILDCPSALSSPDDAPWFWSLSAASLAAILGLFVVWGVKRRQRR